MSVRLHVPDAAEGELRIEAERLHYLTRVLRLCAGDTLEVFDGEGKSFDARVTAVTDSVATLSLGPARARRPPRRVAVIQGLPKGDKLELVLQKCTELGATDFVPARMKRSVVKLDAAGGMKKQQRWQKIAEEAARQSGRADVPRVFAPLPLSEAVAQLPGFKLFILDEEERRTPLAAACAALKDGEPAALLIGPEGGLDRSEVEALRQLGGSTVTMGRRVLRTETAALVALSVLQLLDGELGG